MRTRVTFLFLATLTVAHSGYWGVPKITVSCTCDSRAGFALLPQRRTMHARGLPAGAMGGPESCASPCKPPPVNGLLLRRRSGTARLPAYQPCQPPTPRHKNVRQSPIINAISTRSQHYHRNCGTTASLHFHNDRTICAPIQRWLDWNLSSKPLDSRHGSPWLVMHTSILSSGASNEQKLTSGCRHRWR